jgi:exportin-7
MDSQQLQRVESLCNDLYNGRDAGKIKEAQNQLSSLQSNAEFIPQCQYILDNSLQAYAQHTALISLEILISLYWNNFSNEQKVEIRNYVLSYLATHANDSEDIVLNDAIKLTCRITKLGWFDCPEHREIIEETNKFLDASINHHVIGLKLLNDLVIEMNTPTSKTTLTQHRKTAVSYRDHCLFQSFQTSISTLKSLQSGQLIAITPVEQNKVLKAALTLSVGCLSFDFIGTNPEESSEDVGTVQAPSSWRPVVSDTSIMELYFEIYATSQPPESKLTLQALVQLSSVRRSLFPSDVERSVFVECLMRGTKHIMQTTIGLQHDENYHEFCRLLGRLKASYQLSELVKVAGFIEWLDLAESFSMKSLENWQTSMNSIQYILAMWGRLVAALPYLRADATDFEAQSLKLRHCSLTVAIQYIETMINSVDVIIYIYSI